MSSLTNFTFSITEANGEQLLEQVVTICGYEDVMEYLLKYARRYDEMVEQQRIRESVLELWSDQ